MSTLVKITGDKSTNEYLVFDTEVTSGDVDDIKEKWENIRTEHPTWGRMDCIGELLETRLPAMGLRAEYFSGESITINLPDTKIVLCGECDYFNKFKTDSGYEGVECRNKDCPTLTPIASERACSFAKKNGRRIG